MKPKYVLAFLCIFAFVAPVLLFATPASAGSFTVNDLGDSPDDNIGDSICHTAGGVCTLRAAIQEANFTVGSDTVTITATGTIVLGSALPTIGHDLVINGPGVGLLTISGANTYRVLAVDSALLELHSMTVANGTAAQGGGIFNNAGTLNLYAVAVYSNSSSAQGGGIFANNSATTYIQGSSIYSNTTSGAGGGIFHGSGTLTLVDTNVYTNTALYGGAIYGDASNLSIVGGNIYSNTTSLNSGAIYAGSSTTISGTKLMSNTVTNASGYGGAIYNPGGPLTITNSTFQNNRVPIGSGGALYNSNSTRLTITGSNFVSNTAQAGSAVVSFAGTSVSDTTFSYNYAISNTGAIYFNGNATLTQVTVSNNTSGGSEAGILIGTKTLTLTKSTIANNTANGPAGGVQNYGNLVVNETTFEGNSATHGGAINNEFGYTVTITSSTFHANHAVTSDGGGLYNIGTANITNTTFATNTASVYGGGIRNGGEITLTHVTMSGNSSSIVGGGIANVGFGAIAALRNTILADSLGNNCYNNSGTITSLGYNLESQNTCGLNASGDLTVTNPNLMELANNGGSTQTMALPSGSPALNRIPQGTNGCGTFITTDQRGYARISPCDVGAYESALRLFLPLILK